MSRFGPTRKETWFYLLFSLAGLVLMAVAVGLRGIGGIAAVEVIGLAGTFFGGTAIWAGRKLWRDK